MKIGKMSAVLLGLVCLAGNAGATDRLFTYSYEPETMPQGTAEFEQYVTLRTTRNDAVGQDHFTGWDFKEEVEFGLTDAHMLALGLKEKSEYYREPDVNIKRSEFEFEGGFAELRWNALNPAENPVGLTFLLEPVVGNGEFEFEQKIILGQRFGKESEWKWAFNATHATAWKDSEEPGKGTETEGELEFTFGIAREMDKRWSLGFELRNQNLFPEYDRTAHTVLFVGPVISYRADRWWIAVTGMGQVYGDNKPDTDGKGSLDLEEYEYFNGRVILGVDF